MSLVDQRLQRLRQRQAEESEKASETLPVQEACIPLGVVLAFAGLSSYLYNACLDKPPVPKLTLFISQPLPRPGGMELADKLQALNESSLKSASTRVPRIRCL